MDAAWQAAGRKGAPRKMSLGYFALGEGAREAADRYVQHDYAWLGYIAGMIAGQCGDRRGHGAPVHPGVL